jgi:hypothetical protein
VRALNRFARIYYPVAIALGYWWRFGGG